MTSGGPPARTGFYLARALETPSDDNGFDTRLVTGTEANALSLDDVAAHAAVAILSTRGLDRRSRDNIGAFVRSGGGAIIAAGPEMDAGVLSTVLDLTPALSVVDQADPSVAAQMKAFDFRTVFDRSTIDRLVQEKYFETLFGPEIRGEQEKKASIAFGR